MRCDALRADDLQHCLLTISPLWLQICMSALGGYSITHDVEIRFSRRSLLRVELLSDRVRHDRPMLPRYEYTMPPHTAPPHGSLCKSASDTVASARLTNMVGELNCYNPNTNGTSAYAARTCGNRGSGA